MRRQAVLENLPSQQQSSALVDIDWKESGSSEIAKK
jgi:hypothetical protein